MLYRLRENWSIVELKDIERRASSMRVPDACRWRRWKCRSIRRRSGRRSSTRRGASIATTSTRRISTARTGRRCARSTRRSCRTSSHRSDLNRVIQWMCSELAVGHHRGGGGDSRETPSTVPGGLLGADYAIENGRYRFKKIYGGLNWNPELRAPLTEPGVNVKAGEYLLAVERARSARADQRLQPVREHVGQARSTSRSGRMPTARGAGRCRSCRSRRGGAAQSRLGRRQPEEGRAGDGRPRGVRLRAEHGGRGLHVFQALLLSAGEPRGDHRRRALQRRRSGRGLLHRHSAAAARQPLGDAVRRRSEDAGGGDPRAEGDDHRRNRGLGRRPAAVDVP